MIAGTQVGRLKSFNLLATGTYTLIPRAGNDPLPLWFLPQMCWVVLRTLTGPALSVAPKFKIGGNAAHDDVAGLYTTPLNPSTGVVLVLPTLVASGAFVPVDLRSGDISLEVTVAGVGPTAMVADVLLLGWGVSD